MRHDKRQTWQWQNSNGNERTRRLAEFERRWENYLKNDSKKPFISSSSSHLQTNIPLVRRVSAFLSLLCETRSTSTTFLPLLLALWDAAEQATLHSSTQAFYQSQSKQIYKSGAGVKGTFIRFHNFPQISILSSLGCLNLVKWRNSTGDGKQFKFKGSVVHTFACTNPLHIFPVKLCDLARRLHMHEIY